MSASHIKIMRNFRKYFTELASNEATQSIELNLIRQKYGLFYTVCLKNTLDLANGKLKYSDLSSLLYSINIHVLEIINGNIHDPRSDISVLLSLLDELTSV
jgi:hypothetical protein